MNALDVITDQAPCFAWLIVCWRHSHAVPIVRSNVYEGLQECISRAPSSFQSRSIHSRVFVSPVGPVWSTLFQILAQSVPFWCDWQVGREAQLIFILARGSFSLPPLMRMKTLYLASLMSDVLKSYNKQTQGGDSWNMTSWTCIRRMVRTSVWVDLTWMFPEEMLFA